MEKREEVSMGYVSESDLFVKISKKRKLDVYEISDKSEIAKGDCSPSLQGVAKKIQEEIAIFLQKNQKKPISSVFVFSGPRNELPFLLLDPDHALPLSLSEFALLDYNMTQYAASCYTLKQDGFYGDVKVVRALRRKYVAKNTFTYCITFEASLPAEKTTQTFIAKVSLSFPDPPLSSAKIGFRSVKIKGEENDCEDEDEDDDDDDDDKDRALWEDNPDIDSDSEDSDSESDVQDQSQEILLELLQKKDSQENLSSLSDTAHSKDSGENLSKSDEKHSEESLIEFDEKPTKDSQESLSKSDENHSKDFEENLYKFDERCSKDSEENLSISDGEPSKDSRKNLSESDEKHSEESLFEFDEKHTKDSQESLSKSDENHSKDSEENLYKFDERCSKDSEENLSISDGGPSKDSRKNLSGFDHVKHSKDSEDNLSEFEEKDTKTRVRYYCHSETNFTPLKQKYKGSALSKEIESFSSDVAKSDGFEVGHYPLMDALGIKGTWIYKFYDRETTLLHPIDMNKLVCLSRLAICIYNKEKKTNFGIVKVLKAMTFGGSGVGFNITFEASLHHDTTEIFQTRILTNIPVPYAKIEIVFVKVKPN